ncbi:MAG: DUF7714 family protein [Streptosporangiaceae bacterium]
MNLVPSRYRAVAVTEVDVPLDEWRLRTHFRGRPAYRRTRYIVVRAGAETALVEVDKHTEGPLFSEITAVRLLARPGETAYVRSPGTDVGVPSQLARAAAEHAPGARCVVVQGRYEHVNVIVDPSPLRVHVVEVAPPGPPKLVDQASRVLDLADDLPPVELVPEVVDLADLARERPSAHYLLPCRGSGVEIEGAEVSFLDQIPQRADWTLVGCARSRAIHRWFYGENVPTVEMCPRELVGRQDIPADAVVLTKCCMREEGIETDGRIVIVPWGASLAEIRDGLAAAVDLAGATAGESAAAHAS